MFIDETTQTLSADAKFVAWCKENGRSFSSQKENCPARVAPTEERMNGATFEGDELIAVEGMSLDRLEGNTHSQVVLHNAENESKDAIVEDQGSLLKEEENDMAAVPALTLVVEPEVAISVADTTAEKANNLPENMPQLCFNVPERRAAVTDQSNDDFKANYSVAAVTPAVVPEAEAVVGAMRTAWWGNETLSEAKKEDKKNRSCGGGFFSRFGAAVRQLI